MKKYARRAGILLSLLGLTLGRAEAVAPAYTITDLGQSLTDGSEVDAVAINSAGQVLLSGPASDYTTATAYLYQNGALQSLGLPALPGDTTGQVWGLSDTGQVVGWSRGTAQARGFLKGSAGYAALGTLGASLDTFAFGVGKTGHVVGASDTGSGVAAFLYSGGVLHALPSLPGSGSGDCGAVGVNGADQVVGYAQTAPPDAGGNTIGHATLWQSGTVQDLGSLAGPMGNSFAEAINDHAQIVGASDTAGGGPDAFFLSGGAMQDLGTLGGTYSDAHSLNNTGQIVGESDTGLFDTNQDPISHAFLWQNGAMADLNAALPAASGWTLTRAVGINDAGQIVGTGQHTVGGVTYTHAFLLTPITAHWSVQSLTVGADGAERLLWTGDSGAAAFWRLDAQSRYLDQRQYGPFPGWSAQGVTAAPDGSARAAWAGADGRVALWDMDAAGGFVSQRQYGPFAGWAFRALAAAPDGTARALWECPATGEVALWRLDARNGYVDQTHYGPFAGWHVQTLTVGADGAERLLWTGDSGAAAFWRLDAQSRYLDQRQYGPFPGWSAQGVTAAPDGSARAAWAGADGRVALWDMDAAGGFVSQRQYGPFAGWAFRALAAAPDGTARALWECPATGEVALWRLDARNGYVDQTHYGPYY